MNSYRARLIELGRVIGEQVFDAPTDELAWNESHEGLDPYGPCWVEVTRLDASESA